MFFAPAALVGIALIMAAGGVIVRLLWNWLLPPLFGWREITFWQAFGLLVLCRILFGGLGRHGSGPGPAIRRRFADRLADRVDERWQHMSAEDRERFRQRMRERCGFGPTTGGREGAI
jgi:hypothetical protein